MAATPVRRLARRAGDVICISAVAVGVAALVSCAGSAPDVPAGPGGNPDAVLSLGREIWGGRCVACHGTDGLGNQDLHSPPIVQLDDWYLLNQLRNFKSGARGAAPGDTWGMTMRVNSLVLTDQAMQDVIAYVQTLR